MALESGDVVAFTILGEPAAQCAGRVAARSHITLELLSQIPARPGDAVKVERNQSMYLGEVRSCRQLPSGYALSIDLQHALYDTAELARLARKLLDERL